MTATSRTTTVLIVGGGPSGLAAASELAHHGVDCVVVEPRREVTLDRPRAKTTNARTMEHFRRWGVADAVRAAAPMSPEWSDRVVFAQSLTGDLITAFDGCFGLTDPGGVMAERGQQIPQPLVERVLREHLAANPFVDLLLGATLVELVEQPQAVLARIHLDGVDGVDDGGDLLVEADWVLGCDGANGIVRRTTGIHFTGDSDPRSNFNMVFTAPELKTDLGPAVQYWSVGSEIPGVVGRLDLDGTWWAIAPGIDAETGWADPSALLTRLVGRPFEHTVTSTDPWTARMLVADRYRSGRMFLVGEAAHLNPPWGGHGYNTCVGDAVNIGWKLAAVSQGWAAPELLDSYEAERRPVAVQTIEVAVTNMATLSTDIAAAALPSREGLADFIQRSKRAEFHSLGLVLGYSYAGSPVIQADNGVQAEATPGGRPSGSAYEPSTEPGGRLPHAILSDGRALYDVLDRGFTLLGPLDREPDAVEALLADAETFGMPLTAIPTPPGHQGAGEFLLVRPDQHIAVRARSARAIDVSAAVARRQPNLAEIKGDLA